jgi:signal transduction histidine kinase
VTGLLLAIYILVLKNLAGALAGIYGVESGYLEGLLIVFLVFLLRPVERYVSRVLDQIFLRELHSLREKLGGFSQSLLDCLELNDMACKVTHFLNKEIGFPRVLFLSKANGNFNTACQIGWKKQLLLSADAPFLRWLSTQTKPVEWLDVARHFASQPGPLPALDEVAVVVPLQGKNTLLGALFLSNFADRRRFSTDWLEMLDIFSGQVAMAILRVHMIQKVQERERELVQAEKLAALGRLVATVSHEIRNPLGVIRASAETLLEQSENLTETQREILQFILDETDRLNRVLNSFLDFARPRPLQKQPLHLKELLRRVVHMLEKKENAEKFRVIFSAPTQNIWIEGDSDQLYLAFLNLGLNGLEAMPEGGTLKIEEKRLEPDRVVVRVIDQGRGIPKSHQKQVFEPFFSTKENGSGIGLAVTRRIVEEHGGTIHFRTTPAGTIFEVVLPVKKVESET